MGQQFLTSLSQNYKDESRLNIQYLPYGIDHSSVDVITKEIKDKISSGEAIEDHDNLLNSKIPRPDVVIVHGDTRSALAGARAARDLNIILAHVEAGVRSFNNEQVEEKIRIEIDHLSNYNFCPTPQAVNNLARVGMKDGVYFTGDIMYDRFVREREHKGFTFVTIHRQENIENEERLRLLIDNLKGYNWVIFPLHPHTNQCLAKFGITKPENVEVIPPLDHKQTLWHIRNAKQVLTDSGGIQREAFWSGTPCKVLRDFDEWSDYTQAFGDGHAGDKILDILTNNMPYRRTF